jgi:glyoxylase-like metal-dependent hydrolase (beta-lactamase superfamily II)
VENLVKIQFERSFDPQYGTAVAVSPLIRRVVANNGGPFTFTGTGTYIIGTRKLAVIDPGPVDEDHLQALLAAIGDAEVSHIIITHTHMDHSPLAEKLKKVTGAKTYAYGPHGAGRVQTSGDVQLDAGGDMAFVPDVTIADGDVLNGPDWNLESVFTPGHTSNHMSFGLKEENALFSGDHVMSWSTSVIAPPDGYMADYFASLKKLMGRKDETYWPTHGGPRQDPRPFVRAFLSHRKMREAAIATRIAKGDRKIADIVKKIYADVDRRLHPAAAMSTMAHIEHLIERGLVKTDGELSLSADYRTA